MFNTVYQREWTRYRVFFNKAIFEKYGVEEPQTGWTWEDMTDIAKQLKTKITEAGSDEYPILMELDAQPSFFNFINQSGGFVLSEDMKTAGFDQKGTVKAFSDMVSLMDEGLMPGSEVLSDTKGTDLFLSQKGAILFMGSWKTSVIDEASFADPDRNYCYARKRSRKSERYWRIGLCNQC